jgi:GT2 family glycosyltransferase
VSESALPVCSVIVPSRGRPAQLASCVEALLTQDYPPDRYEVLVVLDGETESDVPRPAAGGPPVAVLSRPHGGPGAARNTGARGATGDLLAFTDDDCRPDPGWLKELVSGWDGRGDLAVGGHTVNGLLSSPFASVAQMVIETGVAHLNAIDGGGLFFASNNLAVPAAGFRELGGFDERFRASEDRDLCDRWLFAGRRLAHVPAARVWHAHVMGLAGFWRQNYGYGRGAYTFHRAYARRRHRRVRLDPTFYQALASSVRGDHAELPTATRLALLGVWGTANAAGYLREWALGPRE